VNIKRIGSHTWKELIKADFIRGFTSLHRKVQAEAKRTKGGRTNSNLNPGVGTV
jgi:hypothetical protein